MTQQYTGENNLTISMPDGDSVPIVSQTEIDPMKTALSLMLARHDDGTQRAAARAEAAGAGGGSCPQGYFARLVLRPIAGKQRRYREA